MSCGLANTAGSTRTPVYLDYTGGGLYAASQVRQHADLLTSNVFGNPHSVNPSSLAMTALCRSSPKPGASVLSSQSG